MSMKAYLAENEPAEEEEAQGRVRGHPGAGSSSIKDDDLTGWGDVPRDGEDEDDAADAVVAADRRFKKRQRTDADSGWQTVRGGEDGEDPAKTPPPAEDEQPQVVEAEQPFKGGLLTSAQLKKRLPKAKRDEKSREEEEAERAAAQETVYRDSSGRKVDMAAAKAEAARLKREREEKEAAKMEWGKGLVQRGDEEKRRQEEQRMRGTAFARTVDDRELNEQQRAEERWNDPAAAFLMKKKSKGPRKPEYTGPPPPPNRFGIKPGYRWDGVDRSNGFEKRYYQKQNERRRRGAESYEWSVDDM
ncbi:Pre-mRNA-splicing factor of RES complex-domain-containing protein [Epithele typhae]|uniref:Pre-mRNA-splicing factor of RES complex-domain-containing protein n=1 Tax=Epithele typhae TaxID=378194 RepID=UPI0020079B4F|nr:Pre-mRNA-splicing factor of RES complex-domain-containing protein [Epithele typhae]KAH9917664.1 Pre-mRNA-splicing factor of RES complex-domain-containing protein [Epithele typhae]